MKKKYIVLTLTLLLILSMFSVSLFAVDEWDVSAAGDNSVTAKWDSSTRTLTISGEGAMNNYGQSTVPYYSILTQVENVVISDGITHIGDYAFYYYQYGSYNTSVYNYLTNLTSPILIPSSVESIGKYAFQNMNEQGVVFEKDSRLSKIDDYAFSKSLITSFEFPSSLKTINACAFSSCSVLSEVILPEGLESIGEGAFTNCTNLTYVYIPSSVNYIDSGAFYVSASKNRVIENRGGAEQVVVRNAFDNDNSDAIVVLFAYKENTSAINSIKTIYTDARYYEDVGEEINMADVEFVAHMDVSATESDSVVAIWNPANKTLTISGNGAMRDFGNGTQSEFPPYSELFKKMESLVIEEGVTYIGRWAFYVIGVGSGATPNALTQVTSVEIPASVEVIGEMAFFGGSRGEGSSLNNITFAPNSQLKEIGDGAFCNTKLVSVELPDSVEKIGESAFSANNSSNSYLQSIRLSKNLKTIGDYAFEYCENLEEIEFPYGLESIGNDAFHNCSFHYIYIPASVTNIGGEAFYKAYADYHRTVVNMNEGNQTVGSNAFFCYSSDENTQTINLYSTNKSTLNSISSNNYNVSFIDEAPLTGVLDNGIVWTYDPDTHTLSFEGVGEIPNYSWGSQPWFTGSLGYGGVGGYNFGGGISGIGSGVFGYYGGSSSWGGGSTGSGGGNFGGVSASGPSGLRDTIENLAPGASFSEIASKEEPKPKEEGIHVFVDDEEVSFPDVQPHMQSDEIYAPLRFINNDLGATVEWIADEQKVLIKRVDNGHYVEIALKVGSSKMTVNGQEYDIGATVIIDNDRCLLPGRSIVKFWETVRFKADYEAPSFNDYYYRQSTPVDGEDNKILDYPQIDEWIENGETLTPENEEEVLGARRDPDPDEPDPDEDDDADNIIKKSGGSGKTVIILDAESTNFKVAVPIMIEVSMDANGTVSIPTSYVVSNESAWGPVVITNVSVVKAEGWSIADISSDFANMKADSKVIGLSINGVTVSPSGSVEMNESLSSTIKHEESKPLTFEAKLPAQKSAFKENALAIVFTVDFDKVQ